jgi:RHS repeat-associated protein
MPHLASIEATHRDQMHHADLGGGGDAYYTYDAGGERVRKWIQRIGTTTEERIYLGGWEIYRKRTGVGQAIETERETLHVMDGARRIALVETLTVDDEAAVATPVPRLRYQYGNHLGSAMLECDHVGDVISYEEYHPYGTAAYRSAKSGVEVSEKRYRYTGKERDDETGFTYHLARYYAPWLGRWTSADPAGIADDLAIYTYVSGNPIGATDPTGRYGTGEDQDDVPAFLRWNDELQAQQSIDYSARHRISEVKAQASLPVETRSPSDAGNPADEDIYADDEDIYADAVLVHPDASEDAHEPRGASHKLRVWTGPFTMATGDLQRIADSTQNKLEWLFAHYGQLVLAGPYIVENIPNVPDFFYSAVEEAATVKHAPTVKARAERALRTGAYTLEFVAEAGAVAGPLATLSPGEPAASTTLIDTTGGQAVPRSVGAAAASPTTLYKPTQTARRFDFAKVDRFAESMRNGTWDWSVDKIIVDIEGNILSGHHRVLAAERAGVHIPETAIHRLKTVTSRPVYDWSDILGE